jgi:hypothetical protein
LFYSPAAQQYADTIIRQNESATLNNSCGTLSVALFAAPEQPPLGGAWALYKESR